MDGESPNTESISASGVTGRTRRNKIRIILKGGAARPRPPRHQLSPKQEEREPLAGWGLSAAPCGALTKLSASRRSEVWVPAAPLVVGRSLHDAGRCDSSLEPPRATDSP